MRRTAVTGLTALAIAWWPGLAHADETIVIAGTSFPTSSTYLTYFGCGDLYHADSRGPTTRVVRDEDAPAGRRATALAMPGTGTATGPVSLVKSVGKATASLSVDAPADSQGVAYVWYVSRELEAGEVWAGRADLATSGAGWQEVDTTAADYTWTRLEAATGTVLEEPGAASIADFTAEHGDGPGYLLSGFGCDAREFSLDRLQVGTPRSVTTYDLEGWSVRTAISLERERVAPGVKVQVTGTSVDPWQRVMGAPLVLEARPEGAEGFEPVKAPVEVAADGSVVATVAPRVTTDYRWVFPETAYADAHRSTVARVSVEQPTTPPPPEETQAPEPQEPSEPAGNGAKGSGAEDEQPLPDLPSGDQVTESQEPDPSTEEEPAEEPTDQPTSTEPASEGPASEEPATEEQPAGG